jgi:hypothetical protein
LLLPDDCSWTNFFGCVRAIESVYPPLGITNPSSSSSLLVSASQHSSQFPIFPPQLQEEQNPRSKKTSKKKRITLTRTPTNSATYAIQYLTNSSKLLRLLLRQIVHLHPCPCPSPCHAAATSPGPLWLRCEDGSFHFPLPVDRLVNRTVFQPVKWSAPCSPAATSRPIPYEALSLLPCYPAHCCSGC